MFICSELLGRVTTHYYFAVVSFYFVFWFRDCMHRNEHGWDCFLRCANNLFSRQMRDVYTAEPRAEVG